MMYIIQGRRAHDRKKAAWRSAARGRTTAQGADQSGAAAGAARQFCARARGGKKSGDVAAFFGVEGRLALRIPMMAWSVACGFPSPAEDYVDRPLDFNELLIEHPAATFAIRIEGDSMTGAGIARSLSHRLTDYRFLSVTGWPLLTIPHVAAAGRQAIHSSLRDVVPDPMISPLRADGSMPERIVAALR
jgi:hypothetical protein